MGLVCSLDAISGERCEGVKFGRPSGEEVEIVELQSASKELYIDVESDREPLNADRTVLRDVLMRGVEEYVEFGKVFVEFETTAEGVNVRFADGSEVEGSLLVGADGARSRVRKQLLPELEIVDREGRFMYGRTAIIPQLLEKFDVRPLEGMTGIHDRTLELSMILLLEPVRFKDNEFTKYLPDDYIYWVLLARKDRFKIDDEKLLRLSSDEAAALSRKCTSDWHPSL